jgi:AraC family transcriptional regulator
MKPVADTIAAVGKPVFLHAVGEQSSPKAMVARWRHSGGDFDIAASDIVSVVVNLQDGVPVRHKTGDWARARVLLRLGVLR